MDASGAALLTWLGGGEMHAALHPAGGAFGPIEALGPGTTGRLGFGGVTPSVTLDANGRALAVWGGGDDQILAATRPAGGSWITSTDLSKIAENPPALVSDVKLHRRTLGSGATALGQRATSA